VFINNVHIMNLHCNRATQLVREGFSRVNSLYPGGEWST